MSVGETVREIKREEWMLRREGVVEEVVIQGGALRFRVTVWDAGRQPFLTQWFNDVAPAVDFLEKVIRDAEAMGGKRMHWVED